MKLSEREYRLRKERGERAFAIRKQLLKVSRAYLCKKYQISLNSYLKWEEVKRGGMTENGANTLVDIFKKEGVEVTVEWLMYGVGNSPIASFQNNISENIIIEELRVFLHRSDTIHAVINDDAMAPWLMPGDYVAGEWHSHSDLNNILGTPCIIQLSSKRIVTRILQIGVNEELYTLTGTNPTTSATDAVMHNVEIRGAAAISWIRKVNFSNKFNNNYKRKELMK